MAPLKSAPLRLASFKSTPVRAAFRKSRPRQSTPAQAGGHPGCGRQAVKLHSIDTRKINLFINMSQIGHFTRYGELEQKWFIALFYLFFISKYYILWYNGGKILYLVKFINFGCHNI
jgi:hypothetical protein